MICLTTACFALPLKAQERPLSEVLLRVPADAFENTTDGIEPEELKTLLVKGESASWTLKHQSSQQAQASARRGGSDVRLARKTLGDADVIEVLTLNEKAVSYGYWAIAPGGGPLARHDLPPRLRLFNETDDGSAGTTPEKAPPGLLAYVEKFETCQHWLGEVGDDASPARRREIAVQLKQKHCDTLSRDKAGLERSFKGQPRWLALISRADRLFAQ